MATPTASTPTPAERGRTPRAVWVFVLLAAGLALGRYGTDLPAAGWLGAACGALVLAALTRGRTTVAALALACTVFGAGWFVVRIREAPPDSLAARLTESPAPLTVTGIVLDTPARVPGDPDPLAPESYTGEPDWAWRLRVESVDPGPGPARGVLRVRGAEPGVRAGDRVRVTGLARTVPAPMNPGEHDRRLSAAQDGVAGSFRAPRAELIERLIPRGGPLPRLFAARLRWAAALHDRVRSLLGVGAGESEHAALLAALLLGEEQPALRDVRSAFTRVGLAHVLAISGFHMAVLAGVALLALRVGGDGGRVEPVLVAVLIVAYLAILPVSAPVWRSGLMVLALLAADAAGRRYDRLAVLAWTGVALLVWRPMDFWSLGFQLSFGLLAVLIRFGPVMHARLWGVGLRGLRRGPPEGARAWVIESLRRLVSANVLCWLVSLPLIAYHTGQVSLLAVVAGVVVVPLVTLLLAGAYATVAVGLLIPPAAALAQPVLAFVAKFTTYVVWWMDGWPPASVRVAPVSLAWAAGATMLVLYLCTRARVRRPIPWLALVAAAAWFALEQDHAGRLPRDAAARIDTLSVGDGTCHLVRAGGGAILWDCGSTAPGVGRYTVPRALLALGVARVEAAVITHPDLDHYNGLLDAAGPLGLRTVYVGECFNEQAAARPGGPEALVLRGLGAFGIDVRVLAAGDAVRVGEASIEILGPPPGARWVKTNDHSLVGLLRAGSAGVLLTGDIEAEAMGWLTQHHPDLAAAAVEAPHHGSARPDAYPFVAALGPRIVIQSTGPDRVNDARWDGVRAGRVWLTTATDGAITTEVRRDGTVRARGFRALMP